MPRTVSRSPSYRRRHSPSPVGHRYSRRSRRDRSRSPYSYGRWYSCWIHMFLCKFYDFTSLFVDCFRTSILAK
ncbi:hypothetical protein GIB67_000783 [Kingdonia uniflora]|uniref:Uncharacterized protein n=1 Tax=Kingdonia uniflora TaxID=39325 RepID=A0A7J7NZW2_9MAGN|nr:hypothetical protein GIB67_000783 [Kingdonia uniflora]